MAKAADESEQHIEASVGHVVDKLRDFSALRNYGCVTVAQCTIIAILVHVRGEVEDQHFKAASHYMSLARLDILAGRLNPKHPLTHIPFSEYARMITARLIRVDETDMKIPMWAWLVPIDDLEGWLQSKGIHCDLDGLRLAVGGPSEGFEQAVTPAVEAIPTLASYVYDWQSQARIIADECFDRDTRIGTRDSLFGYCKRVVEEMVKRGIRGTRGVITNPSTVKREALQGKKWWWNKQK